MGHMRVCTPVSRGLVRVQAQEEGFFSDAFKAALQTAMDRDQSAAAGMYADAYNRDSGYSRSEGYASSYSRPAAPPAQSATAGPLMQIVATALGQARATLERLQAEEAEIENLIQRERKQVERLEWLLEKVQQDYAYFDSLQRRFEQETSSNNGSSTDRWYR